MIALPGYYVPFDVGDKVILGVDIVAQVTAVLIESNNHVKFRCVWWDGGNHCCDWFDVFELVAFEDL